MTTLTSRHGRAFRACAAGAVAAVAFSGCSVFDLPLPGGVNTGSNPIKVHVMFRDVLDLVPQSSVKVNDVAVGRVTAIKLNHDVADVTVQLPHNVALPANAVATIRQTSLLGEKFVSMSAPADASTTPLANGSVIGLDRTGNNPEIEQVLGALGALLSGGGVGQLKLITEELNKATGGREQDIRSVLDQLNQFMGQLAQNKDAVVSALDNLDRLAQQLKAQEGTIKSALDDLPSALSAIDKQRGDLEKMLAALQNLSGVGVRVISASKQATIQSFRDLVPILSQLAAAGDLLPKNLSATITYPYPDAVVGTTPDAARKFQEGDYLNLSVHLDVNVGGSSGGGGGTPNPLCTLLPTAPGCPGASSGGSGGGTNPLPLPLPSLPGGTSSPGSGPLGLPIPLPRVFFGSLFTNTSGADPLGAAEVGYDPGLTNLLFEGALS